MNKALAIIYHYGSGKADFVIRATGKMEWNGPGPEPTDEQLEQWDAERIAAQALTDQGALCITRLNESERAVSQDPPYPSDIDAWILARAQWRKILKSGILQKVPPKPF